MTMKQLCGLMALLVLSAVLTGCQSPEATPSPSPTAAAEAPGPKANGGSAMSTDVAPAPPGVKTDLSGGMK